MREREGEREVERVDQLRLPFCLLLIFVSSRSRFVFLCFLTVCYFFDVSFVRFFTSRRDTFSLLESRQTVVFIYCGFQQQKLQTKISKMGFCCIVDVAYKKEYWKLLRNCVNC